jgi:hypothetical protein
MSDSFESAYAYARACGSLARSYLGERAASLAMSPRVGEAWRSIFGEPPPALPEGQLADAAERGLRARAYRALKDIAGSLVDDEPFFASLVRSWETAYVKLVLSAAAEGAQEAPDSGDPCLVPSFDRSGYPDLDKMFRRSRYRWIVGADLSDLPSIKNSLDKQYYLELWESLSTIPLGLEGTLRDLVRVEAELSNIVWALRLKKYYSMGAADIEGLLIELPGIDVKASALDAAGRRLDTRSDWSAWKWERFTPDTRGTEGSDYGDWSLDVRGLEIALHRYLYRRLYRRLHLEPDSYVVLYAYFRIKEFETRAIHGIIEGIKLEAPAAEIGSFALDTTGGAA